MDPASTDLARFLVAGNSHVKFKSAATKSSDGWSFRESLAPAKARILSLGAGVQSTALLLLAAQGRIKTFDIAVFADTGWEPQSVYEHLDRLVEKVAKPAGIRVERVSFGDLRADSLSPDYTTTLPLFIDNLDGSAGMLNRQCTQNYKLIPIYRLVRRLLGASESRRTCPQCEGTGTRVSPAARAAGTLSLGECSVCRGTGMKLRVGPVTEVEAYVSMAIGFSTDEIVRVSPSRRKYVIHEYPLLDLGWSRKDTMDYLVSEGFASTPRSACIGCPYHSQDEWRRLRHTAPHEWADAVRFDEGIRSIPGSSGIQGEAFLHRDRIPLALAVDSRSDEPELPGCSPFGCRTMASVDIAMENKLLDEDERIAVGDSVWGS